MTTTASEKCKEARKLWLSAISLDDLDQVEALYKEALNAKRTDQTPAVSPRKKKRKLQRYAELSAQEYRQAGERLSLLYCQSGRTQKAKKGLDYLGFVCRLSKNVLDYPSSRRSDRSNGNRSKASSPIPCVIYDSFLNSEELSHLRSVFASPGASYWTSHNYEVEPPSPYFSYVISLKKDRNHLEGSFVDSLARKVWKFPALRQRFPSIVDATHVELWAHNRPHASGHQMHFDSDDEGRGGVRNPIVSTILYVCAEGGGPSIVTNQQLDSVNLANKGWLAHPKPSRLVAFDGRVLHGVVPGKGVSKIKEGRRVTLMFAFWKKIKIRNESSPGSARPFPLNEPNAKWAIALSDRTVRVETKYSDVKEQKPIELDNVYERLDGSAWKKADGMLDYEQVFQGF